MNQYIKIIFLANILRFNSWIKKVEAKRSSSKSKCAMEIQYG